LYYIYPDKTSLHVNRFWRDLHTFIVYIKSLEAESLRPQIRNSLTHVCGPHFLFPQTGHAPALVGILPSSSWHFARIVWRRDLGIRQHHVRPSIKSVSTTNVYIVSLLSISCSHIFILYTKQQRGYENRRPHLEVCVKSKAQFQSSKISAGKL
jgi:hypothetical protein